jgi:hypothetical protein
MANGPGISMSRLSKAWWVLRARTRRWVSDFHILPATFQALALLVLIVQTLASYMRSPGRTWRDWASWKKALGEAIVILICTIYLRYEEKFRKFFFSRGVSHGWKVRMAGLSGIIDKTRFDLRQSLNDFQVFRSNILECVVSGVAEVADLPEESLCATLLQFLDSTTSKMVVVTRSNNLRGLNQSYDSVEDFAPWRAVKRADIVVENDYVERAGIGPRPYRSIIVIPITKDGRAYGSLSIDCTTPYAFYGRELQIYYQVRPYVALLALTYGAKSPYHECFFDPAHLR